MWNPTLNRTHIAVIAAGFTLSGGYGLYRYLTAPAKNPTWMYPRPAHPFHDTVIGGVSIISKPLRKRPYLVPLSWQPLIANGVGYQTVARDLNMVEGALRAKRVPMELNENPDDTSKIRLRVAIEVGGSEDYEVQGHPDYGVVCYKVTLSRSFDTEEGRFWCSLYDQIPPNNGFLGVCSPEDFPAKRTEALLKAADWIAERWLRENPSAGPQR